MRSTYIRIVTMIVGLVAVLWVIRSLRSGAMDRTFEALGLQPAQTVSSPQTAAPSTDLLPGEERLNLCAQPIVALVWNAGVEAARRSIEERKDPSGKPKWVAVDSQERDFPSAEIEKWTAEHCRAKARPVAERDVTAISARLPMEIRYADGSIAEVDQIGGRFFRIGKAYYESPELADSLKGLRVAARFEAPSLIVPAKVAPREEAPAEVQKPQNPQ